MALSVCFYFHWRRSRFHGGLAHHGCVSITTGPEPDLPSFEDAVPAKTSARDLIVRPIDPSPPELDHPAFSQLEIISKPPDQPAIVPTPPPDVTDIVPLPPLRPPPVPLPRPRPASERHGSTSQPTLRRPPAEPASSAPQGWMFAKELVDPQPDVVITNVVTPTRAMQGGYSSRSVIQSRKVL